MMNYGLAYPRIAQISTDYSLNKRIYKEFQVKRLIKSVLICVI